MNTELAMIHPLENLNKLNYLSVVISLGCHTDHLVGCFEDTLAHSALLAVVFLLTGPAKLIEPLPTIKYVCDIILYCLE